jgi:hypothetical protein
VTAGGNCPVLEENLLMLFLLGVGKRLPKFSKGEPVPKDSLSTSENLSMFVNYGFM